MSMPKMETAPLCIDTEDRGVLLCVPATTPVRVMLDELATLGIFGRDVQEVAERFICEGLQRVIQQGWLDEEEEDDA